MQKILKVVQSVIWDLKNQPVMQLETLSISSRIKKEGGCFAKTVFETKRQDVTIMQTIH